MSDSILIEKYLIERGLFQPADIIKSIIAGEKEVQVGEEILNNDELLARVAGMYQSHRPALEAVIRARIFPLVVELVLRAYPQETIVLRQSIVEIAAVLDDFKKYNEEFLRREQLKNNK